MRRKSSTFHLQNIKLDGQTNPGFVDTEFNGLDAHDRTVPTNGHLTSIKVEGLEKDGVEVKGEQWKNPIEFLLSCIAMSVGLGNVWRFPFTAYENGGGTFLVPYLIVLFFIGKPLYYLEMALGQFSSYGQVKVWKLSPIFKGIGYGAMVGTWCVLSYYCSLMALTVYYFIASFSSKLPWSVCDPGWIDIKCNENLTAALNQDKTLPELYFEKTVFPQLSNINNGIGEPELRLTLCLFTSWALIFLSLIKGVKSSGKVAYFTALFPYVVLFTLLIRGLTLEGSWEGVKFLFEFKPETLLKPEVWFAAVTQCFFSLSTGFGPIIMFSSYNPFTHNVHRDAFIISIMDTLTSLLASFTIFSILGSLAHENNVPVKDVVKSGPGLAFISYPDAIAKFNQPYIPQLFSVLFFLMLFTLGVGSASALTSGVIRIIHDQFPSIKKLYITIAVCFAGFLSGLIYVTPGGLFMLTLVDYFGAAFVIYVMVILEVVAVCWVYGLSNICRDIEFMLKRPVSWYWRICWGLIIPVGLSSILVYTFINLKPLQHDNIPYPAIALIAGWTLFGGMILLIPICAIHTFVTRKSDTFWGKLLESIHPAHDWGPKNAEIREEWRAVPPKKKTIEIFKETFLRLRRRCQQHTV